MILADRKKQTHFTLCCCTVFIAKIKSATHCRGKSKPLGILSKV